MAVFTFTGDPNGGVDPQHSSIFGIAFEKGVPFTVSDNETAARLRRHTHFTETGGAANLADGDGDGSAGGSAATINGFKAVHNGGGRYIITDGNGPVIKGLTKADAETFNALPDEEKAAKVQATLDAQPGNG